MPTYEYRCPKCGHFEVEQRITEDALTSCPSCGSPVKRLVSRNVAIQFKGPGFHVNDYPSSGRKGGTPDSPAPKSGTSPETPAAHKTETKTAASE